MPISNFVGKYRFLSNFFPARVKAKWYDETVDTITVEHAFQAQKAIHKGDFYRVLNQPTPGQAKRVGRKIPKRPDWDGVKLFVMEDLLRQKFQDQILKGLLLETGEEELIEGNDWHDFFWGVCEGRGENYLGKLLMQIREELRNGGDH